MREWIEKQVEQGDEQSLENINREINRTKIVINDYKYKLNYGNSFEIRKNLDAYKYECEFESELIEAKTIIRKKIIMCLIENDDFE